MIARVFKPGCKVDYVPVLSSAQQGLGKSTAILILGGQWAGELSGDLHKTDSILQMHGKWILEFSEMDSIGRSMESTVKAFITRQTDTFRTPYGRMTRDVPRSCIFAGTSNNAKLLTDTTGNRRFLVLTVGAFIDREALIRDRDQLFAEAYVRFLRGERWYMSDEESRMATLAQAKRLSTDHITDVVLEQANALAAESVTGAFKMVDLLVKVFKVNIAEIKISDSNRVKRSLTAAGFTESAGVWRLGTLDETMTTMSNLREKARESLEKIEVEEVKTQEPNLF
jgi:predicted P-loop ATPase